MVKGCLHYSGSDPQPAHMDDDAVPACFQQAVTVTVQGALLATMVQVSSVMAGMRMCIASSSLAGVNGHMGREVNQCGYASYVHP